MNDITILYDMPIHTDREISANRPDIVIKNNRDKKCALIDVAIPLIKTPPKRFPKNFPSIKIWKSKLAENVADEDRNNSSGCSCVSD